MLDTYQIDLFCSHIILKVMENRSLCIVLVYSKYRLRIKGGGGGLEVQISILDHIYNSLFK